MASYAELGDCNEQTEKDYNGGRLFGRRSLDFVRSPSDLMADTAAHERRRQSYCREETEQFKGAFPGLVLPAVHKRGRPVDLCIRCKQPGSRHINGHICEDGCHSIFLVPGRRLANVQYIEKELVVRKNDADKVGVCYIDVEVTKVFPRGGAELGGMKPGQRILRIDGKPMTSGTEVQDAFAEAGKMISVVVGEITPVMSPPSSRSPSPTPMFGAPPRAPLKTTQHFDPKRKPSISPSIQTGSIPSITPQATPQADDEDDPFADFMESRMSANGSPAAP